MAFFLKSVLRKLELVDKSQGRMHAIVADLRGGQLPGLWLGVIWIHR